MRERIWPDAFRRPPAFFVFVRHGFTRLSRLQGILCPTRGVRIGKVNFSQGAYSLSVFCLGCLGILGSLGFTGFVCHGFTRLSRLLEILCPTRGVRIGKANFSQGAYSLPAFCLGILGSLDLKAMHFLLGYLGILGLLFFSGHSV